MSIDETTDVSAANILLSIFAIAAGKDWTKAEDIPVNSTISKALKRQSSYLTHEVFNKYHTETEMMRYIKPLHDFPGFLHHEAERCGGNAAPQSSGIHVHASACSRGPGRGLP